jgi:hypothetical protein
MIYNARHHRRHIVVSVSRIASRRPVNGAGYKVFVAYKYVFWSEIAG